MYQSRALHPSLSDLKPDLPPNVEDAMWNLFLAIGQHWQPGTDHSHCRSQLRTFMWNRIALLPLYLDYYKIAARVVSELIAKHSGNADMAYKELFTSEEASRAPPTTPLALTRQLVSNEFVTLHFALGGALAFGARNAPGYFGGANIPGNPPYRPMEG